MTSPVREGPAGAVHASRTAIRSPLRALVISTLIGAFLGFVGVQTGAETGFLGRILHMIVIAWVAMLFGVGFSRLAVRLRWAGDPSLKQAAIAALMMTAPMGLVVWLGDQVLADPPPPPADIPGYILVSAVISIFMNLLVYGLRRERTVVVAMAAPPPPKFLERLPLKLRGAEVWAVEAEDHYLRLHTSKGQDLILMRLADAVAELEGIEGARVHRSWWVARDAITDARRGDGRATLTLKDGAEVPVSRTYASVLRERGWI